MLECAESSDIQDICDNLTGTGSDCGVAANDRVFSTRFSDYIRQACIWDMCTRLRYDPSCNEECLNEGGFIHEFDDLCELVSDAACFSDHPPDNNEELCPETGELSPFPAPTDSPSPSPTSPTPEPTPFSARVVFDGQVTSRTVLEVNQNLITLIDDDVYASALRIENALTEFYESQSGLDRKYFKIEVWKIGSHVLISRRRRRLLKSATAKGRRRIRTMKMSHGTRSRRQLAEGDDLDQLLEMAIIFFYL